MNKATELLRETFGNIVIRYTVEMGYYAVVRHNLDTHEVIVLLVDTDKTFTDKIVDYHVRMLSRK